MRLNRFMLLSAVLLCFGAPAYAVGPIRPGMTTDQLIAIKGNPYYQTEHFANRTGEQVWLYTKKKEEKTVEQKEMLDPQTNWQTLYRKTVTKTCEVGDVFVQVSKGQVQSVNPANSAMSYGPCTITSLEEFLPIVDGKPATTPSRRTENTVFEQPVRR